MDVGNPTTLYNYGKSKIKPMSAKVKAFEYLLVKLVGWHQQETQSENNDISVLKGMKLLFFVSAVNSPITTEDTLLDKVFNNFVAMPYGHVESDIYSAIRKNELENVTIDNYRTTIDNDQIDIDQATKDLIEEAVIKLRSVNKKLILMSPFDLVELSHKWSSWKVYIARAKRQFVSSASIPTDVIKKEDKIWSLY